MIRVWYSGVYKKFVLCDLCFILRALRLSRYRCTKRSGGLCECVLASKVTKNKYIYPYIKFKAVETHGFSSADFPVRPNAENLVFEELDVSEGDGAACWRLHLIFTDRGARDGGWGPNFVVTCLVPRLLTTFSCYVYL